MSQISKEEIIYYLTHPDFEKQLKDEAKNLRKALFYIDKEICGLSEELLESGQLSGKSSDVRTSKTNNQTDLYNVIEESEKKAKMYRINTLNRYNVVLSQIDTLYRFNLVYSLLLPESKEILTRLYVNNEKWEAVEMEMRINHRILVQTTSKIFEDIQKIFSSDMSNEKIAKTRISFNKKRRKTSDTGKADSVQLNINDFF